MKLQTSTCSGYMGIVITAVHWSISPFLITWLKIINDNKRYAVGTWIHNSFYILLPKYIRVPRTNVTGVSANESTSCHLPIR